MKKNIILIIIAGLIGLGIGYYSWGKVHVRKTDVMSLLDEMTTEIRNTIEESATLKTEIEAAKGVQAASDAVAEENQRLTAELDAAKADNVTLNESLSTLPELESRAAAGDELASSNADLEIRVAELEGELEALSESANKISNLTTENQRLADELNAAREKNNELDSKIFDLNAKGPALEEAAKNKAEAESLRARVAELEAANAELSTTLKAIGNLTGAKEEATPAPTQVEEPAPAPAQIEEPAPVIETAPEAAAPSETPPVSGGVYIDSAEEEHAE